jgi:hypothetical protein
MLIKKYENLLKDLNQKILDWSFKIDENKEKLEKIIEIYKELKAKNYKKAKGIIKELDLATDNDLWFYDFAETEIQDEKSFVWSIAPSSPAPQASYWFSIWFPETSKKESCSRDWNTEIEIDEDNVEAFNSIEMMSAIFLQNIKDQLWTQI